MVVARLFFLLTLWLGLLPQLNLSFTPSFSSTLRHSTSTSSRESFSLQDNSGNVEEELTCIKDLEKRNLPRKSIPPSVLILPLIPLVLLLPAGAIDNPVDYIHLNIPNPIPDADPRYFLSGGLCAAASHGVTTPIDVVKTRMQAEPEKFDEGVLSAAASILNSDGSKALLGGLGPTVVGYGLEGAAKFGLYESLKPEIARVLPFDNPAFPYLIASCTAGAVASLILCPMEKTRIRLVTDPDFASGLLTGIPRLVEESGFMSLFSGLGAMLSKQVPYTCAKQVSFDVFATFMYAVAATFSMAVADVKIEVAFGAAFLASVLACIMSQPGDVLLTATYKDPDSSSGFTQILSDIYEERGIKGFFTGISARLIHVGVIITSQLVLYDTVKQLLGLPATGAN
jgi:solute carrier family 25 phosphate transporter 3